MSVTKYLIGPIDLHSILFFRKSVRPSLFGYPYSTNKSKYFHFGVYHPFNTIFMELQFK